MLIEPERRILLGLDLCRSAPCAHSRSRAECSFQQTRTPRSARADFDDPRLPHPVPSNRDREHLQPAPSCGIHVSSQPKPYSIKWAPSRIHVVDCTASRVSWDIAESADSAVCRDRLGRSRRFDRWAEHRQRRICGVAHQARCESASAAPSSPGTHWPWNARRTQSRRRRSHHAGRRSKAVGAQIQWPRDTGSGGSSIPRRKRRPHHTWRRAAVSSRSTRHRPHDGPHGHGAELGVLALLVGI